MVTLLLLLASDGQLDRSSAVWHASLNATSGLFVFKMVTGADHDRLAHLMAGGYALVATGGLPRLWPAPSLRNDTSSAGAAPSGPPSSAPYRGARPQEDSHDMTDTQLDTRQRAYSWEDQEATRLASITQDGLAVLHAIGAGTLPLPPAVRTLGIEPVEASLAGSRSGSSWVSTTSTRSASSTAVSSPRCWTPRWAAPSTRCCHLRSAYVTGELNVRFLRPALLTWRTARVHGRGRPPGPDHDGDLRSRRRRRRPGHRHRRRHLSGAETVMHGASPRAAR